MKLTSIDSTAWAPQRVLAFGDSKSGKTTLASLLARKFRLKWLDLENGFKPLLKLPQEQQANVELYPIPDTTSYPIAIETLMKVVTGVKCDICSRHGKVDCGLCKAAFAKKEIEAEYFSTLNLREMTKEDVLVVDSLTQLGISAMNRIIHGKPEEYKPDWDDYRRQGTMLDRVLSSVQQSWYHVVFISHTTQAKLEDGKTKLVPVCGTDNFSRNVAKYFDHVVYCEVGTGKHNFGSSTVFRPQVLTGSRTDVALEKIEKDVTLLPIFENPTAKPNTAAVTLASATAKAAELAKK